MMRLTAPILALACLALALAGCGGTGTPVLRASPPDTLAPDGGYPDLDVDTRPLVAEITEVRIEPTPGGVIVHAVGLPPFQEYWGPELVEVAADGDADGSLRYEFRLREPIAAPVLRGPARSRQVEAAAFASEADLRGISRITVVGAGNSRSRSR